MVKRLMFLILCLAMLVGMGLATTAAIAGDGMFGEMRYRWEGFKNFDDRSSDFNDNYGFSHVRSRLGYSTEIGERGLFNMSVQNNHVMGAEGTTMLLNEGQLGISDLLFEGFDAYAGRFALAYGRERVLGAEEWAYASEIRFDGFKGHYVFEKGWVDLLCLKLNETFNDKYNHHGVWLEDEISPNPDHYITHPGDRDLRGIYAHFDAAEGMYIEPYVLMMSQDNVFQYRQDYDEEAPTEFGALANDNYLTFGALFDYMSDMGLHFYAEALMKSGTTHGFNLDGTANDVDTSTLGFYSGLFYEVESTLKPFIGAEFNYATGQKQNDPKNKLFVSEFGSNSSYMGIMDMVDWSNTATIRLSGGLTPVEGTDLKLDFYLFNLATDADAAYGYNLTIDGVNNLGIYESKKVGSEIDFFVNHKIEDGVSLEGGAAMFSFGDYFGVSNTYDSLLYGWLGAKVEF